MGVLDSCEKYQDYIEIMRGYVNEKSSLQSEAFSYLEGVVDEKIQKKAIASFRVIDSVKGESNIWDALMKSRISSFLAVGTLLGKYGQDASKLKARQIALLAKGAYSSEDNELKKVYDKMIGILTNNDLLEALSSYVEERERGNFFTSHDAFFKVGCHFIKRESDSSISEEAVASFVKEMIERIHNNTLDEGVPNYEDYLSRLLGIDIKATKQRPEQEEVPKK